MAGAFRPIALMLAVVIATTAFFRCDLPAYAASISGSYGVESNHHAGKCAEEPRQQKAKCEIAQVIAQDKVDASSAIPLAPSGAFVIREYIEPFSVIPFDLTRGFAPPVLISETPITLHNISRN